MISHTRYNNNYSLLIHQNRTSVLLQADTYNIHQVAINFAVVHVFLTSFCSLINTKKSNILRNKTNRIAMNSKIN